MHHPDYWAGDKNASVTSLSGEAAWIKKLCCEVIVDARSCDIRALYEEGNQSVGNDLTNYFKARKGANTNLLLC